MQTYSDPFLSYFGRPGWLPQPRGARWSRCQTSAKVGTRVIDGTRIHDGVPVLDEGPPGILPCLLVPLRPPHHGYGRPRREDTDRELLLYVAWARDIARLSLPRLAKLLNDDDFPRSHPGTLKWIERCLADGRRLYSAEGVLPWGAYPGGRVPTCWEGDRAFGASVRRWQVQAIDCPAEEAQPGDRFAELAAALRQAPSPARLGARLTALRTSHLKAAARDLGLLHAHGVEPWRAE